jgi:S-adenosylmethionine:tRNA ribosyltransferase-isomerase
MKISEFFYDLPRELIAQHPPEKRDSARLMVIKRSDGDIKNDGFRSLAKYLKKGDCLVLNDTRVIPARLFGRRKTGAKVELFLIDPYSETPTALVKPSKRISRGETIELEGGSLATVFGEAEVGRYVVFDTPIRDVLKSGHVPLPPYVDRLDTPRDREDYQTVYASREGATASPTAGLHFTKELLEEISGMGVNIARVTLHTNYGTFSPVKSENVEDHKMHEESYELRIEEADIINTAKFSGGRVIAVGTTSAKTLETCSGEDGKVKPSSGKSKLFIYPGYRFKIVDGMVTNFHLPESSLLLMVSAFAGSEVIKKAYTEAVRERYRFFSYGDAMLMI